MGESTSRPDRWLIFKQMSPFAILGTGGILALALIPERIDTGLALVAIGLTVALVALSVFAPWHRLPEWMQSIPPLAYLGAVGLLREAAGGAASGLGLLALLTVIWFALHGSRRQVIVAIVASAGVFVVPAAFMSPEHYPDQEWVRAGLWVAVTSAVGFPMQNLVRALSAQTRASAERAAESEAATDLLGGILEAATEYSIIGTDAQGTIVVFNAGAERMLGYSAEEVIGRVTPELIHDPGEVRDFAESRGLVPGFEALVGRAAQGEHETRQWTYVRKDGNRLPVELTISATRCGDGRINGFIGIASDISQRLHVEEELLASEQALRSVSALSKAIATSDNARESICEAARQVTEADLAVLMEAHGTAGLRMTASVGVELPEIEVSLSDENSGTGRAFTRRERLFVPDAEASAMVSKRINDSLNTKSLLFEPVLRDDEVVGVLVIGWLSRVAELSSSSSIAAGLLATEAAMAIERADLLRRLEGAALTDALTGLPNRRAWDEALPEALEEAGATSAPASVAIFDLDHFKKYNDRLGHQAGDRLLVAVGAAWRQHTREGDVLARYGGEEFILLMRDCDPADALDVVERIRGAVPAAITCSAGIAHWEPRESADDLVARADLALYAAKEHGRDNALEYSGAMAG